MRAERKLFAVTVAVGVLSLAAPAARADGWIGSWGASDVFPVGQDVNFQTLRQFVRLSAGGNKVRVRFSNATGQYPLVIGAAHVAKPAADAAPGAIDPATDHALTFGGPAASLWRRAQRLCPIRSKWSCRRCRPWRSACLCRAGPGPAVIHLDGVATTYISDDGDFTAAATMPSPHTSTSRFFIDEVDVEAAGQPGAVVTLGELDHRRLSFEGRRATTAGPTGWRNVWRRGPTRRPSAW